MAASKTMKLAAKARKDTSLTPYDLWEVAAEETETVTERRGLFRHAMIHAGMIISADTEKPYLACPVCGEAL